MKVYLNNDVFTGVYLSSLVNIDNPETVSDILEQRITSKSFESECAALHRLNPDGFSLGDYICTEIKNFIGEVIRDVTEVNCFSRDLDKDRLANTPLSKLLNVAIMSTDKRYLNDGLYIAVFETSCSIVYMTIVIKNYAVFDTVTNQYIVIPDKVNTLDPDEYVMSTPLYSTTTKSDTTDIIVNKGVNTLNIAIDLPVTTED